MPYSRENLHGRAGAEPDIVITDIRLTLQKMAEDLSKKKIIRYTSIKIIRKLSYDIKKLLKG